MEQSYVGTDYKEKDGTGIQQSNETKVQNLYRMLLIIKATKIVSGVSTITAVKKKYTS
jgi:hypothetical protein